MVALVLIFFACSILGALRGIADAIIIVFCLVLIAGAISFIVPKHVDPNCVQA